MFILSPLTNHLMKEENIFSFFGNSSYQHITYYTAWFAPGTANFCVIRGCY